MKPAPVCAQARRRRARSPIEPILRVAPLRFADQGFTGGNHQAPPRDEWGGATSPLPLNDKDSRRWSAQRAEPKLQREVRHASATSHRHLGSDGDAFGVRALSHQEQCDYL
jgi:hypothetical protein